MPFKVFVTGEVLDHDEVNTYFMKQAVLSFASLNALTTAVTSPTAGMFAYITDLSTI